MTIEDIKDHVKEMIADKEIGYDEGQELPNISDESLGEMFETKAEAFFTGNRKILEKLLEWIGDNPPTLP